MDLSINKLMFKKHEPISMFNEGDEITLTEDCAGHKKGEVYTLVFQSGELVAKKEGEIGYCNCQHKWQLVTKDWTNLEAGDVIINDKGNEKIVEEVTKNMFAILLTHNVRHSFEHCDPNYYEIRWITKRDAKKLGWKIKGEEPLIEEMTVSEVCDELGREIKIKK